MTMVSEETSFDTAMTIGLAGGVLVWVVILVIRLGFCFKNNAHYSEKLLKDGFEPVNDSGKATLKFAGLYTE